MEEILEEASSSSDLLSEGAASSDSCDYGYGFVCASEWDRKEGANGT